MRKWIVVIGALFLIIGVFPTIIGLLGLALRPDGLPDSFPAGERRFPILMILFPVIGIILIIVGFILSPSKKAENGFRMGY